MQHTEQAARKGEIGVQQIANILHGVACSGRGKCMGVLFRALARAAEQRVGDFKAQNLANTAWAFATAGQLDSQLFTTFRKAW